MCKYVSVLITVTSLFRCGRSFCCLHGLIFSVPFFSWSAFTLIFFSCTCLLEQFYPFQSINWSSWQLNWFHLPCWMEFWSFSFFFYPLYYVIYCILFVFYWLFLLNFHHLFLQYAVFCYVFCNGMFYAHIYFIYNSFHFILFHSFQLHFNALLWYICHWDSFKFLQ